MTSDSQRTGASSLLLGVWRSRPGRKRLLSILSILLTVGGLVLLTYPILTNVYNRNEQSRLAKEFASPEFKTKFQSGAIADGDVLTRIRIPGIGVDALVVEGTTAPALRAGSGHYRGTALPCATGNVAIAGHRTTYGKPFNRMDEVVAGDEITLSTPLGTCTYRVVEAASGKVRPNGRSGAWITTPNDTSVLAPLPGSFLTLTTCHPKGSAAKRLILRAELVST